MKYSLLLLLIMVLTACNSTKKAQKIHGEALFRHWVHSHEDDGPDYKVYRPASYQFPPSRGREGFDIQKDGTFIHFKIGATDQPEVDTLKWELKGRNTISANEQMNFQILEVSNDQLRIK